MAYRKFESNGKDYVEVAYKPVTVTRYQPMERKY
jgi:hypothetical protein